MLQSFRDSDKMKGWTNAIIGGGEDTSVDITVTTNPPSYSGSVYAVTGGKTYTGTISSGTGTVTVLPGYDYTVYCSSAYNKPTVHVDASGVSVTLISCPIKVSVTDTNKTNSIAYRAVNTADSSEYYTGYVNASSGTGTVTVYVAKVGTYKVSITAPTGGSADDVTVTTVAGSTVTASITVTYGFKFTMNYSSTNFVSAPDSCLSYADDCVGFTPVSGPGSTSTTPAKCTTIGSWEMNADGTSNNPLLEKCFYATFTDDGILHQKLNPQDLTKYIATWDNSAKKWVTASGTSSITSENTMFCVPTLYVSSTATSISLSSKADKGTAFGHTIDGHVYQYMAIAVYPGNGSATRIKSISGATSTVSISQSDLVAGCKTNTVQNGHAMLCNWYQWQLYRLMVIFAMRHFNSQTQIGQGGQSYDAQTTGLLNTKGLFAGSSSASTSTTSGVKAFIENPWGHNNEYLGDFKYLSDGVYAFQTSTQSPSSVTGGVNVTASPHSLTSPGRASGVISTQPETWGWGTSSRGSATTGGCDYQNLPSSSGPYGLVGGSSDLVSDGNAGVSYLYHASGNALSRNGGRSVFVFDL